MNKKTDDASELIERLENETGCRIDDNEGDNLAMAGLVGAISRIMKLSPPSYQERDDVVAGLYIQHLNSHEGKAQEEQKQMLAELLASGLSPDDIGVFYDKEE